MIHLNHHKACSGCMYANFAKHPATGLQVAYCNKVGSTDIPYDIIFLTIEQNGGKCGSCFKQKN